MAEHRPIELSNLTKWRAIYKTLLNLLIGLIVLVALADLTIILVRQNNNTGLLQDVHQSNQILVDCTTPGHKCYDDAQKSSSTAIQQLDQVIILASSCAATLADPTAENVQQCVENGLK